MSIDRESEARAEPDPGPAAVTRRDVLKAGAAAAVVGFTRARSPGAPSPDVSNSRVPAEHARAAEGVMATLAAYMKEAQSRPLPADAAEHTRLHVLDTFAAMISGSDLAPGQAAHRFIQEYSSPSQGATVVRAAAV